MGKIDTYTKNRVEGLAWALELIKKSDSSEEGVKRLEKEVEFRRANFMPLEIPTESIKKSWLTISRRLMNTILIAVLKLCEEEFGWGKVRLQRMVEMFSKHSAMFYDEDPLGDRYVKMSEYALYFREKYDIAFSDEVIEELIYIEEQNEEKRLRKVQFEMIEKHLKNSYPEALEHLKKTLGI